MGSIGEAFQFESGGSRLGGKERGKTVKKKHRSASSNGIFGPPTRRIEAELRWEYS
jgi:hypothetical protein